MPNYYTSNVISCADTTTGTNDLVWTAWISTTNSTIISNTVWTDWNTTYVFNSELMNEPPKAQQAPDAERKAEALLRSFLTPEQEESYFKQGYFDLMVEGGNRPARHYRINRAVSGNIKRLENGKIVESLCVHPQEMPTPDINLCQMLELMHREDDYRKIANITRVA